MLYYFINICYHINVKYNHSKQHRRNGESPKALKCGMKVRDAVVIVHRLLSENNEIYNKSGGENE